MQALSQGGYLETNDYSVTWESFVLILPLILIFVLGVIGIYIIARLDNTKTTPTLESDLTEWERGELFNQQTHVAWRIERLSLIREGRPEDGDRTNNESDRALLVARLERELEDHRNQLRGLNTHIWLRLYYGQGGG